MFKWLKYKNETIIEVQKSTLNNLSEDYQLDKKEFKNYMKNFSYFFDDENYSKYKDAFLEYREAFINSEYTTDSVFP